MAGSFLNSNFSLNGYEPLEKVKTLRPNEKAVLEVNLKKLPAGVSSNPDLGFLNIITYNLSAQAKIKGISKINQTFLRISSNAAMPPTLKALSLFWGVSFIFVMVTQPTKKIEFVKTPIWLYWQKT